eukprot:2873772-Prymnesium_polylepis.1
MAPRARNAYVGVGGARCFRAWPRSCPTAPLRERCAAARFVIRTSWQRRPQAMDRPHTVRRRSMARSTLPGFLHLHPPTRSLGTPEGKCSARARPCSL